MKSTEKVPSKGGQAKPWLKYFSWACAGSGVLIGLVGIVVFLRWLCLLWQVPDTDEAGLKLLVELAQMGDYLGGVTGSIWSLAGLLMILAAFLGQQTELGQHRKEMQRSRHESTLSNSVAASFHQLNFTRQSTAAFRANVKHPNSLGETPTVQTLSWFVEYVCKALHCISDQVVAEQVSRVEGTIKLGQEARESLGGWGPVWETPTLKVSDDDWEHLRNDATSKGVDVDVAMADHFAAYLQCWFLGEPEILQGLDDIEAIAEPLVELLEMLVKQSKSVRASDDRKDQVDELERMRRIFVTNVPRELRVLAIELHQTGLLERVQSATWAYRVAGGKRTTGVDYSFVREFDMDARLGLLESFHQRSHLPRLTQEIAKSPDRVQPPATS